MDTNKQTVEKGVKSSGDKLKISNSLSHKAKRVISPSKNQLKIPSPSQPKTITSPPQTKLKSPHKKSPDSKIPSQQIVTHTPVRVSSRISERKKNMEKSLNSETTTTLTSDEISTKQEEKAVNEDIVTEDIEHIPPQNITNVPLRVSSRISERKKRSLNETLESKAINSVTSEETISKQKEESVKEDVVSQDIEEILPQTTTDAPVRVSLRISERKNKASDESRKSVAETPSTSEERNPKQNEEAVEKDDMVTLEHEEPPPEIEDSGTDCQTNQPRHKVNIEIKEKLKKVLEQDFHLINNKNKLIALPAQPTVISILESWVLDYTTTLIEKMSTKRHRNREAQYIIDQTIDDINLCREMADGIRVYFDYTLAGLLLYGVERDQCNSMVTIAKTVSVALVLEESITINDNTNEANITVEEELVPRESPPKKKFHEDKENEAEIEKASPKARTKQTLRSSYLNSIEELKPSESVQETKQESENVSRLTKSRSKSPRKEPESSEPLDEKKQDTENLSSSASTSSKGSSGQGLTLRSSSSLINLDLVNELTGKTEVWRLVKDDKVKSSMPSNIYGAIHLVRLFVRLPDLLGRSDLTKDKLKIVLKYIRMFLSYLEIHEEWFGEQFYMLKMSFEESNTNP